MRLSIEAQEHYHSKGVRNLVWRRPSEWDDRANNMLLDFIGFKKKYKEKIKKPIPPRMTIAAMRRVHLKQIHNILSAIVGAPPQERLKFTTELAYTIRVILTSLHMPKEKK